VNLDELRDHQIELRAMESRLLACLVDVRGAIERTEEEIEQASRAELRLRSLDERRKPRHKARLQPIVALEDLRAAAARLQRFVASELAAELGCSPARARQQLARITDVVQRDGIVNGQPRYRYVGATAEPQTTVTVGDLAVRRREEVRQPMLSMVACKDLRPVVSDALNDGWRLVLHKGARHHLRLEREGRKPIGLPTTPRNPSVAAKRLRRQLAA
jgi:hypothetical protein